MLVAFFQVVVATPILFDTLPWPPWLEAYTDDIANIASANFFSPEAYVGLHRSCLGSFDDQLLIHNLHPLLLTIVLIISIAVIVSLHERCGGVDSDRCHGCGTGEQLDSRSANGAAGSTGKAAMVRWKAIGTTRPESGHELVSPQLADLLQVTVEFTREQWDALGIGTVHESHFVKSGDLYYRLGGNPTSSTCGWSWWKRILVPVTLWVLFIAVPSRVREFAPAFVCNERPMTDGAGGTDDVRRAFTITDPPVECYDAIGQDRDYTPKYLQLLVDLYVSVGVWIALPFLACFWLLERSHRERQMTGQSEMWELLGMLHDDYREVMTCQA